MKKIIILFAISIPLAGYNQVHINQIYNAIMMPKVPVNNAQIRCRCYDPYTHQETPCDFSGLICTDHRCKLFKKQFNGCNFTNADFSNAQFPEGFFVGSIINGANFSKAHLAGANFSTSLANFANFEGANIEGAKFNNAKLKRANLNNTQARNTNFYLVDFTDASLVNAFTQDAIFRGTKLKRANIFGISHPEVILSAKKQQELMNTVLMAQPMNICNMVRHDGVIFSVLSDYCTLNEITDYYCNLKKNNPGKSIKYHVLNYSQPLVCKQYH